MFRILPYLLLTMFLLMVSKISNIYDVYFDQFHIAESIAKLDNKPTLETNGKNDQNTANTRKQLSDELQLKAQVKLFNQLKLKSHQIKQKEINSKIYLDSLNALQNGLDERLLQLNKLQGEIKNMVNSSQDPNLIQKQERLVKIYESMKPKDAAKIFNNMNNNLLIDVTKKMKPAKLAAILADMETVKATELTALLARSPSALNINDN